jgi:hypothetical protein
VNFSPLRRDTLVPMGSRQPSGLEVPVSCGGAYKPFGEFTVADARLRSEELAEAGGWGPLSKVAGVAIAWRELAEEMNCAGASKVAQLDPESALGFARRLWVVPPRGSLL